MDRLRPADGPRRVRPRPGPRRRHPRPLRHRRPAHAPGCTEQGEFERGKGEVAYLPEFRAFASTLLGWSFSPKGYAGTDDSPIPCELEVHLPDHATATRSPSTSPRSRSRSSRSPWTTRLTFVDHALRHGDSLVGLSRRQIEAFHWVERGALKSWRGHDVRLRLAGRILAFDDGVAERWGQIEALAKKHRLRA